VPASAAALAHLLRASLFRPSTAATYKSTYHTTTRHRTVVKNTAVPPGTTLRRRLGLLENDARQRAPRLATPPHTAPRSLRARWRDAGATSNKHEHRTGTASLPPYPPMNALVGHTLLPTVRVLHALQRAGGCLPHIHTHARTLPHVCRTAPHAAPSRVRYHLYHARCAPPAARFTTAATHGRDYLRVRARAAIHRLFATTTARTLHARTAHAARCAYQRTRCRAFARSTSGGCRQRPHVRATCPTHWPQNTPSHPSLPCHAPCPHTPPRYPHLTHLWLAVLPPQNIPAAGRCFRGFPHPLPPPPRTVPFWFGHSFPHTGWLVWFTAASHTPV